MAVLKVFKHEMAGYIQSAYPQSGHSGSTGGQSLQLSNNNAICMSMISSRSSGEVYFFFINFMLFSFINRFSKSFSITYNFQMQIYNYFSYFQFIFY